MKHSIFLVTGSERQRTVTINKYGDRKFFRTGFVATDSDMGAYGGFLRQCLVEEKDGEMLAAALDHPEGTITVLRDRAIIGLRKRR